MGILEIVGTVFMAVGCVFALTGSVGVLRMPDFYSRLHPAGKSDTLAQGLILFGLALFAGQKLLMLGAEGGEHGHGDEWIAIVNVMAKLVLLTLLLFLTAPTATHAISKAARLDRHTQISIDGDPAASRVSDFPVMGDIDEQLDEEPGKVLDVHESEDDEPEEPDEPKEPEEPEEQESEEP